MLQFSEAQLNAWIGGVFFPLARVLALCAIAPAFGNRGVPARVRLAIGVALIFAVVPALNAAAPARPAAVIAIGSAHGLITLATEILIGLALGFAVRITFAAVDLAGELIGLQMGLSFASFYDPDNGGQSTVLAEFLGLITLLVFLATNGHLMLIELLVRSFDWLPVGRGLAVGPLAASLARLGSLLFAAGLWLALPLIAALLIVNIALAILNRAAQQLNLFAVGFPVSLATGFVGLSLLLPLLAPALQRLYGEGMGWIAMLAPR